MIEIKHRINGSVLYTAESAQDVRSALEEAVNAKADLRYANLGSANLGYANLGSANLGYADLRYANLGYANLGSANLGYANLGSANLGYADLGSANLRYANLGYADLGSADLRYANLGYANLGSANLGSANLGSADLGSADLGSANLGSANLWSHPLWLFRQDYFSILDQAPGEVAALRQAMVDGKIEGSTYSGPCSCLCGTIAKEHGIGIDSLGDELGIFPDSGRPAEQWFIVISEGEKPLPLDTEEWPTEGVFRLSCALAWLDEWIASRTAIAAANWRRASR